MTHAHSVVLVGENDVLVKVMKTGECFYHRLLLHNLISSQVSVDLMRVPLLILTLRVLIWLQVHYLVHGRIGDFVVTNPMV